MDHPTGTKFQCQGSRQEKKKIMINFVKHLKRIFFSTSAKNKKSEKDNFLIFQCFQGGDNEQIHLTLHIRDFHIFVIQNLIWYFYKHIVSPKVTARSIYKSIENKHLFESTG